MACSLARDGAHQFEHQLSREPGRLSALTAFLRLRRRCTCARILRSGRWGRTSGYDFLPQGFASGMGAIAGSELDLCAFLSGYGLSLHRSQAPAPLHGLAPRWTPDARPLFHGGSSGREAARCHPLSPEPSITQLGWVSHSVIPRFGGDRGRVRTETSGSPVKTSTGPTRTRAPRPNTTTGQ